MMSIEVIMQGAITQFYSSLQGVSLITTFNGRTPMRSSMLEHLDTFFGLHKVNFPGTVFELGRPHDQSVFHYACNHDHTQPSIERRQSFETSDGVARDGSLANATHAHAHQDPRDHNDECDPKIIERQI